MSRAEAKALAILAGFADLAGLCSDAVEAGDGGLGPQYAGRGRRAGHTSGILKGDTCHKSGSYKKNLLSWEDLELWLGEKKSFWRIHSHIPDVMCKFKPHA